MYHRTRRSGRRYRRHGRRYSVTLKQHRYHRAFRFFYKGEFILPHQIDADEISQLHLSSRHQVRQRKHQMPFNRPFQVPRSILRIGTFRQQEVLHLCRAIEYELMPARGHQHSLLHHPQFDFQNLLQMLRTQRLEHHHLVDAVHELRSKLAPRRVHCRAIDFIVEGVIHLHRSRRKSQSAIDQPIHLRRTQVRGHDNDAARKINAPVVAQSQSRFVQNSQQQLPQRVRRLLNLVKQQNRKFKLLRVPLVERFLRQQRMRFAMSQISRRRTNQLGNLVRVLKLGAIDLDAGPRVPEQ